MVKIRKQIFGGYNIRETDEKLNQQTTSFNNEKKKMNQQINDLLQKNIELAKQINLLTEEKNNLTEENRKLEISRNDYKSTLIRQVNSISKANDYKSHVNNRKTIIFKYKKDESVPEPDTEE